MCLVSFVPIANGVIITSNRDENINRANALKPKTFKHNDLEIVYPLDVQSNGSWIGYNNQNTIAVLLNGGLEMGVFRETVPASRGLIIPQILSNLNSYEAVTQLNPNDYNPFTLILYFNSELFEFRWNGEVFSEKKLSHNTAHLWNSSTLYSKEIEKSNKQKLIEIVQNQGCDGEIILFHQSNKYEDFYREESNVNNIKTISTTQVVLKECGISINYKSYLEQNIKLKQYL